MLERRLFADPGVPIVPAQAIDWVEVQEELKRRGVTLLRRMAAQNVAASLPCP